MVRDQASKYPQKARTDFKQARKQASKQKELIQQAKAQASLTKLVPKLDGRGNIEHGP